MDTAVSSIPTATRQAVHSRAGGRCERCSGRGYQMHHRQRRREGKHAIENLVLLCGACHIDVHAHPAMAREEGFVISVAVDREEIRTVPITLPGGHLVLLTTDGTYSMKP